MSCMASSPDASARMLRASSYGTMAAIVTVLTLTVLAELSQPVKDLLTQTFFHHWVGKSVLAVLVWLGVGTLTWAIFARTDVRQAAQTVRVLVSVAILGALVLVLFLVWEALT